METNDTRDVMGHGVVLGVEEDTCGGFCREYTGFSFS